MTLSEYTTSVLTAAGIPIVGTNGSRIDFHDSATPQQKAQANSIIAALDMSQTAVENYSKNIVRAKQKALYASNDMALIRAMLAVIYSKVLETRQRVNAITSRLSLPGVQDLSTENLGQILSQINASLDSDTAVTPETHVP